MINTAYNNTNDSYRAWVQLNPRLEYLSKTVTEAGQTIESFTIGGLFHGTMAYFEESKGKACTLTMWISRLEFEQFRLPIITGEVFWGTDAAEEWVVAYMRRLGADLYTPEISIN